ncbi:MAG: tetratricopeptide repeat protein, partial [Kofleriaceae bacterium]
AAFIPVLIIANVMGVVTADDHAATGKLATVFGLHGFYLKLSALAVRNSISYPIASEGPAAADIALGAVGLAAIVAVLVIPARGKWQPPAALRAAALIWLFGWFPISRIALPLRAVLVADRYVLFATLGIALAAAVGIRKLPGRTGHALLVVIALAAGLRSLDARSSWHSSQALWERAVTENPGDGDAWSLYSEALADAGQHDLAVAAVDEGQKHSSSPRLILRAALLAIGRGDRATAFSLMQQAAEGGEPKAMSNFALLLLDANRVDEALSWATKAVQQTPLYAPAHRAYGRAALAAHKPDRALAAFSRAYELEATCTNRFNLALALLELGRHKDAYGHLEACVNDQALGPRARAILKR